MPVTQMKEVLLGCLACCFTDFESSNCQLQSK